ncbi:MAG: phytanoyl-CoA dioxygenase family protein [Candidatus Latescibacterota bacterium]|nr:phytanoyl-CoA dioxygenase family protein [Candidatus Latescibacterota bacterium]
MSEAYVVDKNLGQRMEVEEGDLPQVNADGEPVVELTQEQKYLFDTRGWLLVPGVLAEDEVEAMRAFALRVQREPESLPEPERAFVAGPLEKLTDHPVVVGFVTEFLAFPHLSRAACSGFRMEGSNLRNPAATPEREGVFGPHNGSGLFRFACDSHHYQSIPGKSFSGLTRVVWELAPVQMRQGGTLLATGSHKAAYAAPKSIQDPQSAVWETYECPAGSVLFFTEALAHSTCPWTNADNERVGIFNLYNSVGSRWSPWEPPVELVKKMPAMRQTLFRGTYCANNVPGYRYGGQNQQDRRPVDS